MPTTITKTVYSFDELSDEAKETAIQNERNGRSYFNDIPWLSEYADSLSAFCDRFGVTTDVHYDDRNYISESTLLEYGESIRGLRLRTYILNNYDLFVVCVFSPVPIIIYMLCGILSCPNIIYLLCVFSLLSQL